MTAREQKKSIPGPPKAARSHYEGGERSDLLLGQYFREGEEPCNGEVLGENSEVTVNDRNRWDFFFTKCRNFEAPRDSYSISQILLSSNRVHCMPILLYSVLC